jgi:hypothetical protein
MQTRKSQLTENWRNSERSDACRHTKWSELSAVIFQIN